MTQVIGYNAREESDFQVRLISISSSVHSLCESKPVRTVLCDYAVSGCRCVLVCLFHDVTSQYFDVHVVTE